MCCSSGDVHPFIWTKSIISQHKYDSRKLSASSLLVGRLSQLVHWRFGNTGGQSGAVFSLPLKEITVFTIVKSPYFAAFEAENINITKQVATPTGEGCSSPVLAPCDACTRSREKSVTKAKSRTGFHIHLVIPLGLYS